MVRRAAVLMMATALLACSGDDTANGGAAFDVELPAGVTHDMVARGQQLFNQQTCFTCHGRNAVGGPLAPALNDEQWLNTDGSWDSLVQVIRDGVAQPVQYASPMPPMGGTPLSDEQIRQLAAYVYAASRGS
jgi:mono/diheme cytochrome c family protein